MAGESTNVGGIVRNEAVPMSDVVAQNVTLQDTAPTVRSGAATTTTDMVQASSYKPADLGDFLSRPVKIVDSSWSTGAIETHWDPWALFLNNAAVQSKIDNFKFLRGDLVMRIVVNGTPFHYGRIMASYLPMNGTRKADTQTSVTKHSQLPHVMLDPSRNDVLEMRAPFIHPLNWIDLTHADGAEVGILIFNTLVALKQSNTATPDPVNFSIFAWMEDVEICMPCLATAATFTAQSRGVKTSRNKSGGTSKKKTTAKSMKNDVVNAGKDVFKKLSQKPDEYSEDAGPVQQMATTVGTIAEKMSGVPFIGGMARATEMGANVVGNVAAWFGWSKPNVIEPAIFVKRAPFAPLAPAEWKDPSTKLTLDPKQEVTVDPKTVGFDGGDEMSFGYLTAIPSYLTSFNWATSDLPESVLFSQSVNPNRVVSTAVTAGTRFETTALAFVAMPFDFWRGSLTYKFQIVASQYHRGRLRITYDPNGTAFSANSFNTAYTAVIDISENKEVEFTIKYAQSESWLEVGSLKDRAAAYSAAGDNGIFYVSVLNDLVAPLSTQGVSVLVWVKGCDDFAVSVPSNLDLMSPFPPQSGEGDPLEVVELELMGADLLDDHAAVNFGETITSFRTLIKRFMFYRTYAPPVNNTGDLSVKVVHYQIPHYPFPFGYFTNAPDTTATAAAINYAEQTHISHLIWAFHAVRGSIRWKLDYMQGTQGGSPDNFWITRFSTTTPYLPGESQTNWIDGSGASERAYDGIIDLPTGLEGGLLLLGNSFTGIELESPNYNPVRFNTNDGLQGAFHQERFDCLKVSKYHVGQTASITNMNAFSNRTFVAAGEDFNVFFFTGAPQYYMFDEVPAPPV